jgi:cbb3-type cytochrome oxidase maturation protein
MDSLLWIVPLSLLLVAVALWAFFWAVDAGQFEDLESPGWSILEEDQSPSAPPAVTPKPPAAPATAIEDKAT